MRFNNKNILIASRFSLLLLYIPFFIVQVFFNIDVQNRNSTKVADKVFSTCFKNQQALSFFKTSKSQDKKERIRLNKRFQPENTPTLIPPHFDVAGYFVKNHVFHIYLTPSISSSHLYQKKLRGPPFFA